MIRFIHQINFSIGCTQSSLHLDIFIRFNPTSYTMTEDSFLDLVIEKVGVAEEPVTVTVSTQQGTADSKNSLNNSLHVKKSRYQELCIFSQTYYFLIPFYSL